MKKKFSVLVEKDEDGYYVATVPSLPGCHTQAKEPWMICWIGQKRRRGLP